MKNPSMAALLVLLPSIVLAQPLSSRLDDASRLSRNAASASSLEAAKGLSASALQGEARFEPSSVVVPGGDFSARKSAPTLTAAPFKKTALTVPSVSASSSRGKGESHPGLWLAGGLLAPVAGAVLGSMVGGVPGAVIGGVIGAAIGFVCLLVAAVKWLGKVWNP